MMRALACVVAALVELAPQVVDACSYDPCYYGSPRIDEITLHTVSPVPRDGAFVFDTGQEDSPVCLETLAPHLIVAVSRGGIPVPGEVVQLAGLPHLLVWRPAALLAAHTTYEVGISVNNDGLGPATVDFGETCGPSVVVAKFTLTTGDGLVMPPELPAPVFSVETSTLDTSLLGIACCPGAAPWFDNGSCFPEVLWIEDDPNDCGFVVGYTELRIVSELPPLPEPLARQFIDQLVVEDETIVRAPARELIGASRRTAACARLERIFLGTGEVFASAEACPSPEVAAMLGPVALDPMLGCADGVRCATGHYNWGDDCVPYEPGVPLAVEGWPYEDALDQTCPDSAPVDSSPPSEEPTGDDAAGADDEQSGADDSSGGDVGEEDAAKRGCACATGVQQDALPLLLFIALVRRRERRAND